MRTFALNYLILRTTEIIWKSDTLFMELWMSLYTIFIGIMFILGMIDSYYSGSVYSIISFYVPRQIWGLSFLFFGLLQLIGLYSNRYTFQKWVLMGSTAFWAFTASITAFGNGHTWIFFNTLMIVLAHVWLYIRVSRKLRIRTEVREHVSEYFHE